MKHQLMVLGTALLLSACSSTPNSEYMKEGASEKAGTPTQSQL